MPVGDEFKHLTKTRLGYLVNALFGTADLHSHFRLKPVIGFIADYMEHHPHRKFIEVGCGIGLNLFEIAKLHNNFEYLGFDLDENSIRVANELLEDLELPQQVRFINESAERFDFANEKYPFNTVLLIDILEHLNDPDALLRNLKAKITVDTIFVVSVPTYQYPRVIGRSFHEAVGHVRDGFNLTELERMFDKIGGTLEFHRYSTGFPAELACALYYRTLTSNRYINNLRTIVFSPFRFMDWFNNQKISCSLMAVFKVRREGE